MIKAILFDLDDTLIMEYISVMDTFLETSLLVTKKYGIDAQTFTTVAREKIREIWYQLPTIQYARRISISSWEALWARFEGDQEEIRQLRSLAGEYRLDAWTHALKAFGINDNSLATELAETYPEIRSSKHILFPEALHVLENLHPQYKMGMVTNGVPDLQREKIAATGIESYFESVVISVEAGIAKPDPRIFRIALEQMEIHEDHAIMVGNNPERDMAGARDAGIKSVWIKRDGAIAEKDHLPDFIINDLTGLSEILSYL